MGTALSSSLRLQIVQSRQKEGLSYRRLADQYQVSYQTVRNLCKAFAQKGESALVPDYSGCGRRISPSAEKVYRLVRLIAYLHPTWGVAYILTRIELSYPQLVLQSTRTYQRRISKDRPKVALPPPKVPTPGLHHDVRQAHDERALRRHHVPQRAAGGQRRARRSDAR